MSEAQEVEVVENWDDFNITALLKKKSSEKNLTEKETYFLDHERMEWEDFDKDVKDGARSFVNVGRALKQIKDRKLHKFEGKTFEDYLHDRLGMSRSQGYRLMETGSLAFEMELHSKDWKPTYESHLRPLVKQLKDQPKLAAEIMEKATEKAKTEKIPLSAKVVKEVLEEEKSTDSVSKPVAPKKQRMKKADFKQQMRNVLVHKDVEAALKLLEDF